MGFPDMVIVGTGLHSDSVKRFPNKLSYNEIFKMNLSVWRDVRSQNGSRSRIVGLHEGNRVWRVSPDNTEEPDQPVDQGENNIQTTQKQDKTHQNSIIFPTTPNKPNHDNPIENDPNLGAENEPQAYCQRPFCKNLGEDTITQGIKFNS